MIIWGKHEEAATAGCTNPNPPVRHPPSLNLAFIVLATRKERGLEISLLSACIS